MQLEHKKDISYYYINTICIVILRKHEDCMMSL